MEVIVFLALGLWIWLQSRQISELKHRLSALEERLAAPPAAAAPPAPVQEPLLLDTPLRDDEPEPLLLDTPLPEPSNDAEDAAALASRVSLEDAPIPFPPKAARPPPRVTRLRRIERWLTENGLAWLGGALLALGGVFFVSVAAQQGWFTPPMRLAAAIFFGAALILGAEWVRRAGAKKPPGQPLVAAMLAGAGVTTFYATAWASHALYAIVGPLQAGALLVLCACVLAALAVRHGQALSVLAVAMALLAPPLANMTPTFGVTLTVCGVGVAGFALAAWRRWAWLAAATALGLYFWFAAAIMTGAIGRALAVASLAALGAVAVALRKPQAAEAKARLGWSRIGADLPAAAIAATSVLLLWAWISIAENGDDAVGRLAWVSGMMVMLASGAVRARVSAPASFAVAVAGLTLGFIFYAGVRYTPPIGDFFPFIMSSAALTALAALFANPHRVGRQTVAAAGAIGAAILAALGAATRSDWHAPDAWLALSATAGVLLFCASRAAKHTNDPTRDRAVAWWVGASAALLLLAVESAFPQDLRSAAHAAVALGFAALFAAQKWNGLRFAAMAGAIFSLGHALSPSLMAETLSGNTPLWIALTILALAATLLFIAARVVRGADPSRYVSESLGASAVVVILGAAFIVLRWLGAGASGFALDGFTEASLRALTLTSAGLALTPRDASGLGLIARWRGHALLAAGLLHALIGFGLADHPWWGVTPASVSGGPIFNALLLAFAANGAVALSTARKLKDAQPNSARALFAVGALLIVVWAISETRRAFHGAAMAAGTPVEALEGAFYALVFLGAALVLAELAQRNRTPFRDAAARTAAWSAIALASLLLLFAHPPWLSAAAPSDGLAMARLLAAHFGATALTWRLAIALRTNAALDHTRFAAVAAAMVFAWSLGHGVVRWTHGAGPHLTGLEGFSHALWPLGFMLVAHHVCKRSRNVAAALRHDVHAILAVAIWPTLLFSGLGLALLYHPWWGMAPAPIANAVQAAWAVAGFAAGAWMSAAASSLSPVVASAAFARVRFLVGVAFVFAAVSFTVRWAFHGAALTSAAIGNVEMWTYSAVWALLGAALFALGTHRADAWARWVGLAFLLITTAKVFLIDMAELSGLVRVGSFVGLGGMLLAIAWFARRASAPR